MLEWLRGNGFEYKLANTKVDKGELNILYSHTSCLKLYDRMGHGFGVTINVANHYDESIYRNDIFNLNWAFQYLKLTERATFKSRQVVEYEKELPHVISDIRTILPRLIGLTSAEWTAMMDWIHSEAKRQFK